jgi:transcription termination factor NusB
MTVPLEDLPQGFRTNEMNAFIDDVVKQIDDYCETRDAEISSSLIKTLISRLTFLRP